MGVVVEGWVRCKWHGVPPMEQQASGRLEVAGAAWLGFGRRWLGGAGRVSWERSGSGENDEYRLDLGLMHGLGLIYPCGCGGEGRGRG